MARTVGLIGARGHTGRELIRLIAQRDDLDLVFAGSRAFEGRPVRDMAPEAAPGLMFEAPSPAEAAARGVDAIILALPNDASGPFVAAIEKQAPQTILVDMSADHRFDDAWTYGLPELHGRDDLRRATRISNPGCYATAGQLAIGPLKTRLAGPAHVFGVSGYSGAGTSPSRKNDLDALRDNFMPYALTGHIHEREMSRHMGCDVHFTPHVAPFFRGISATVHMDLSQPLTREALIARFEDAYANEPLVRIDQGIPELRDGSDQNGAVIGGFAVSDEGRRVVMIVALDNLLKGAAVQAIQNLSLALGLPEGPA
jgi:N-acetyl-gamma-glutamyl-phosphate reductase